MTANRMMRLYKFYNKKFGFLALQKRRLKITTLQDLNDPFEFNAAAFSEKSDRIAWKNARDILWQDKGIVCFSDSWKNPVMWSHYADHHRGICLGFDISVEHVTKVEYSANRLSPGSLKHLVATNNTPLIERTTYTKYDHWKYEREWRAFIRLDPECRENGRWFEDFGNKFLLREVIIGSESNASSQSISNKLGGHQECEIHTARLSFQKFEVAKQLNPAFQK